MENVYSSRGGAWTPAGTWVALLSGDSFSPDDTASLLVPCALSEESDEGVVLPAGQRSQLGSNRFCCSHFSGALLTPSGDMK